MLKLIFAQQQTLLKPCVLQEGRGELAALTILFLVRVQVSIQQDTDLELG